jgi:hypothetical protein
MRWSNLVPCHMNMHTLIVASAIFIAIGSLLLGVLLGRTAKVPL